MGVVNQILSLEPHQSPGDKSQQHEGHGELLGRGQHEDLHCPAQESHFQVHATDAPELELPVYRSPFRFINTIMRSGQQHQENLMEAVQSMARNMAHNMMQSNGMQNQQFQNQNRFQQQYQPNNFHHQGRNDMNYNHQGRNDMNYNMMNGQNFQ